VMVVAIRCPRKLCSSMPIIKLSSRAYNPCQSIWSLFITRKSSHLKEEQLAPVSLEEAENSNIATSQGGH